MASAAICSALTRFFAARIAWHRAPVATSSGATLDLGDLESLWAFAVSDSALETEILLAAGNLQLRSSQKQSKIPGSSAFQIVTKRKRHPNWCRYRRDHQSRSTPAIFGGCQCPQYLRPPKETLWKRYMSHSRSLKRCMTAARR